MDLRAGRDYAVGIWIAWQMRRFHARGGRVVVITGSYGKTSVKELSYDLIRQKYRVVATSRNYNTAVGIAKTIRWELMPDTEWFLAEVGAYRVGEITRFCQWLAPDVGVLTGIARQHLTRFGSWDKIKMAKTEIVRYMESRNGQVIANGNDKTVRELVREAKWYQGREREEVNRRGGRSVAAVCGMTRAEVEKAVRYFRPVPSRFEITDDRYGIRVIDDSYNSNDKSFGQAIEYLGQQKNYTRILVTPGLLELGSESCKVHEELGKQLIGRVDYVILVGDNERTRAIAAGINGKVKLHWIEKTLDFMGVVRAMKLKKSPLVLLENDVPE